MGNLTSGLHRGDTVLVGFKAAEENMTIRRPAVIVNIDVIKNELLIVPLNGKDVPEHKGLLVKADSPEGRAAGLRVDCVLDCRFLGRIPSALLVSKIGHFDENIMQKLDKLLED